MRFLAISGSARTLSTNTHLLRAIGSIAPAGITIDVFSTIGSLPVFSPDHEGGLTPGPVMSFVEAVRAADGLIISSPEYVRTLPGGLKNAIDWLVSREEIVTKPVVIAHASHRGDDMLATLRLVLSTVSQNFNPQLFLRFAVMNKTADEITNEVGRPDNRTKIDAFLRAFADYCDLCRRPGSAAFGIS